MEIPVTSTLVVGMTHSGMILIKLQTTTQHPVQEQIAWSMYILTQLHFYFLLKLKQALVMENALLPSSVPKQLFCLSFRYISLSILLISVTLCIQQDFKRL